MANQDNTGRLSLKRLRMRFVYGILSRYDNDLPGTRKKELGRELKGLPISLRVNGLATLAARMAADGNEYLGNNLLGRWLLEECPTLQGIRSQKIEGISMKSLVAWSLAMTRTEYQVVQKEAMQLLEQAKLIGAALWPGD